MSKYTITKSFDFCYGHRVYVQKLRNEFCSIGDCQCKCRHNHGHQGKVEINLSSFDDELNQQSMVVDFKETGWLKDAIDTYIDHKFIIDYNDPMFDFQVVSLFNSISETTHNTTENFITNCCVPVSIFTTTNFTAHIINPALYDRTVPIGEVLEGFLIVNFVPTSEQLSEWMFESVHNKMNTICNVDKIDWQETPKTHAVFSRQP